MGDAILTGQRVLQIGFHQSERIRSATAGMRFRHVKHGLALCRLQMAEVIAKTVSYESLIYRRWPSKQLPELVIDLGFRVMSGWNERRQFSIATCSCSRSNPVLTSRNPARTAHLVQRFSSYRRRTLSCRQRVVNLVTNRDQTPSGQREHAEASATR